MHYGTDWAMVRNQTKKKQLTDISSDFYYYFVLTFILLNILTPLKKYTNSDDAKKELTIPWQI